MAQDISFRLDGLHALVTAGAQGIGRAITEALIAQGAQVHVCDIDADALNDVQTAYPQVTATLTDIADEAQVADMFAGLKQRWGRLDILVNNAGVNLPGVFHEVTNATIEKTLSVNVMGAMFLTRAALPHMLKNSRGSIVNMSSVNGLVSEPFLSVYSASKGAIVMFTRGIALDYAKTGIRCNAICPGWVDTPINHAHAKMLGGLDHVYKTIDSFQPIGRPGTPREIANLVLFLASDEASFMTGSIVSADGGMTAQ